MRYRAEDFDSMGNLRAGKGLWCVLFVQSHALWLLALEMSVAGGGKLDAESVVSGKLVTCWRSVERYARSYFSVCVSVPA